MTKIIAEIGWNHMGDMRIADQMIEAAANSGADYAKFQTWSVDRLKPGEWDGDGRRQIYEKAELSRENHISLIEKCTAHGIQFLSSVFSIKDAELLKSLGVREIKIPSFESRNPELIKYCDVSFDKIYMSTGTSMWSEIKTSAALVKNSSLTLLHCVSSYPVNTEQANIKKIEYLKNLCNSVGYSDHITGIESAKVAMGFGVDVIEKHFTVDRDLPGRDNKFAILPQELKNLKDYVILYEKMHKWHGLDCLEIEKSSREHYTGRFDG
tara:strand:- start:169 stop:969 length:801 start_codon:yes stop_codon:yes gene_type:complete